MIIIDIPQYVDKNLYEDAIQCFINKAKNNVISVYLAGNIKYPGISDLDLVIVPQNKYSSSMNLELIKILPKRYRLFSHHNPFVVPIDYLNIWSLSPIGNLKNIFGKDVLGNIIPNNSKTNKICTALEYLYSYSLFLTNIQFHNHLILKNYFQICLFQFCFFF